MGFDSGVVSCDWFGCANQLAVPRGSDPLEVVEESGWGIHADGSFRCAEHEDRKPWLS